jgi:hypothetical protein
VQTRRGILFLHAVAPVASPCCACRCILQSAFYKHTVAGTRLEQKSARGAGEPLAPRSNHPIRHVFSFMKRACAFACKTRWQRVGRTAIASDACKTRSFPVQYAFLSLSLSLSLCACVCECVCMHHVCLIREYVSMHAYLHVYKGYVLNRYM